MLVVGLMTACDTAPSSGSTPATDSAGADPFDAGAQGPAELGPPPEGFDYLMEGTAYDEYRSTISEIEQPMPDGVTYPPGLPSNFIPTDGYLEAGAARNQAYFTWLCAWEYEYIAAKQADDATGLEAAADMLEWWATGDFYNNVMQDPERGWVTNVILPMRLGDASGIQNEYGAMCALFPRVASE